MVSFGPNGFPNFVRSLLRQAQAAAESSLASGAAVGPETATPETLQGSRLLLSQILSNPQALMSGEETSLFLKNLLKLPSDVQAALLLLGTSTDELKPETLKALLELLPDASLPVDLLQKLLTDRSQAGSQQLMKFLQGQMVSMGKAQQSFGEVLQHLNTLSAQVNLSPQQAITTLILLYLPWYPLVPPQQLEISFAPPESGGGEEGADDVSFSLVLFLETNCMGRFKIALGVTQRTQAVIKLEHDALAQPHLETIATRMSEVLTPEGLPDPIFLYEERVAKPVVTSARLNEVPVAFQEDQKKVAIQPVTGVSVLGVFLAHTLARVIFELDDQLNLFQTRAQQV